MNLLETTIGKLETYLKQDDEHTLRKIAKDTGINYGWLRRFNQLAIPNPGVKTVQELHDYLVNPMEIET